MKNKFWYKIWLENRNKKMAPMSSIFTSSYTLNKNFSVKILCFCLLSTPSVFPHKCLQKVVPSREPTLLGFYQHPRCYLVAKTCLSFTLKEKKHTKSTLKGSLELKTVNAQLKRLNSKRIIETRQERMPKIRQTKNKAQFGS